MNQGSLSVCLYGSHLFRFNGRPFSLGLRGTTLDLLRYLVVHAGREMRRECIADQFWRNSSGCRQRSALNSAIWRIGKKLPDHPGISLHFTRSTICFAIDGNVPVDTRVLSGLVHRVSPGEGEMNEGLADRLSAALDASEAPFMDGLAGDWALAEQERALNIRLRGLTLLMHWYGDSRRYEDALEVGRRLLFADPFRESVQIDFMWLYVLNGQRAQALRHYQSYAELLAGELDIEPMTETRALYDHIRCDLNASPPTGGREGADLDKGADRRQKFDNVLAAIEQSRRKLYRALRTQHG